MNIKKIFKILVAVITIFTTNIITINAEEVQQRSINNYLDYVNYEWWYNFNDSNLERYILKAVLNNSDIKILDFRVKEYENFVKYTFGRELPTVSASLMYNNVKDIPFNNMSIKQDGFMLPLSVNYELDLFGKNKLTTKSAKKQLEIYNYQLQSAYISLVSSVSTIYFNLVRYNKIISLYDELILIKQKILQDEERLVRNGLSRDIKSNQIRQEVRTLKIDRINILKNRDELLTQFAVILGEMPSKAQNIKISGFDKIDFTGSMDNAISSNVIFYRPDVLAVEKQLEKAEIDIKIARKEFLPTINLGASLVFNDMGAGGFFSSGSTIKSLMAGLTQPIFMGGRIKFNLKIKKIKYEELLEEYRKTTLQAVKEVNDSMVNMIYDNNITIMNFKNYLSERKNYDDFRTQYKNGLISYRDLLTYKQKLIAAEITLVNSKIENYIDYISLYKSTAGYIDNN